MRAARLALLVAGLVAIGMPLLLLMPHQVNHRAVMSTRPAPIAPVAPAPLARVWERPLFAASQGEALPADVPQLLGIAGRLGSDAVALVRTGDGRTRSIAVGDSIDGWRLESLAIDAALFTRGGQRARVPLPADQ